MKTKTRMLLLCVAPSTSTHLLKIRTRSFKLIEIEVQRKRRIVTNVSSVETEIAKVLNGGAICHCCKCQGSVGSVRIIRSSKSRVSGRIGSECVQPVTGRASLRSPSGFASSDETLPRRLPPWVHLIPPPAPTSRLKPGRIMSYSTTDPQKHIQTRIR